MAPCFAFTADQPASWQTVHCDTSVCGTGNWHDDSSTCPAGDTWGHYHGDFHVPPLNALCSWKQWQLLCAMCIYMPLLESRLLLIIQIKRLEVEGNLLSYISSLNRQICVFPNVFTCHIFQVHDCIILIYFDAIIYVKIYNNLISVTPFK